MATAVPTAVVRLAAMQVAALDDHHGVQAFRGWIGLPDSAPISERCALPFRRGRQHEAPDWISARKCHLSRSVPSMDKPPSNYEVTVRVTKDDGHPVDPATFAVAASKAVSGRNASVTARTRPRSSSA